MITDKLDPEAQSRREFMKNSAVSMATLAIGFHWSEKRAQAAAAMTPAEFVPNAFVRIGADDSITVIAKHLEMGQGAYTGIATILAEELDADWGRVRVESAPADAKRYANLVFKTMQGTGGSSAMANSWQQLREAGATARALLVSAAAKQWQLPESDLRVERSVVYHDASQRKATFGALVKTASSLPVPAHMVLKDPSKFTLIGTRPARVDVPAKCAARRNSPSMWRFPRCWWRCLRGRRSLARPLPPSMMVRRWRFQGSSKWFRYLEASRSSQSPSGPPRRAAIDWL